MDVFKELDLSKPDVAELIEECLVNYLRVVSKNNNRPFVLEDKISWVQTYPTAWSNFIFQANLDIKNIDNEIFEIISRIKAGELPNEWLIGPKSKPDNLDSYLESNGFVKKYDMVGMAIDLYKMNTDIIIPPGLNIVIVDNKVLLGQWADVISKGLWNGDTFEAKLFENLLNNAKFRLYLAFQNREPVAASMLQIYKDIVVIDLVATLGGHQGKGIGTAMTMLPLIDGRGLDYRIGVLQASRAGEHMYRKIGFEEFCVFNTYQFI